MFSEFGVLSALGSAIWPKAVEEASHAQISDKSKPFIFFFILGTPPCRHRFFCFNSKISKLFTYHLLRQKIILQRKKNVNLLPYHVLSFCVGMIEAKPPPGAPREGRDSLTANSSPREAGGGGSGAQSRGRAVQYPGLSSSFLCLVGPLCAPPAWAPEEPESLNK